MQKNCRQCSQQFENTDEDMKFYEKIQVSDPHFCPDCRSQNRMAFRNEKTLYHRKCDLCDKSIISIYSPDKPYPVYCQDCFWSDKWDALKFGMDFDLGKSFFPQFDELLKKVPRLAIINKQSENSDFCNYSFANKNCYLTFGDHYEEDSMYGRYSTKNKDCADFLWVYNSELCYECLISRNCYKCVFIVHSEDCQDCYFSTDLKGCKDCLFSSNLRHKQYYILNEKYSKEDYFKKLKSLELHTHTGFKKAKNYFLTDFRKKFPFRAVYQENCQNCEGSNQENCNNVRSSFDCANCEDIAYSTQIDETYDSMDMTCMGYDRSEVCYQTVGCTGVFNCISCDSCWQDNDLKYCNLCFSSKDSFGCISLQRKQYCIFNKQYTKEEYEKMVTHIIENMKKLDEWGKFFPMSISPFGYNETIAQEYYPLTKEQAIKLGSKWKDEDTTNRYEGPKVEIPDDIDNVSEDIKKQILECETCGKNYKIIAKELELYKNIHVPIPHACPDCRHKSRLKLKAQRKLWDNTCAKCKIPIRTTYSPDRPETVYCEECYLKEIY